MSKIKNLIVIAALDAMFAGGRGFEFSNRSAKAGTSFKRNDRKFPYKAPRSMTPEEQAHYDKHKNLNGFYN
jgi:hypothetical protein